jgi:PAS domain S-box-containing protein
MAMDGAGAAREEAQRLRDYAEAAADWFWEMDAGLRFTRMSASSQLPENYTGQDFVGRRIDELIGLGVAGHHWQKLVELLETRLPFRDVQLECRLEGGGPFHLSLSGLPIFAEAGRFTGYRGIGRDLTLLKQAEQELAETSSLLRATLDNIEQGLLVVDDELRIRLWNDRLCQFFRNPPTEYWVGRPVADMIYQYAGPHAARATETVACFGRCVAQRKPGMREIALPDGRVFKMRLVPMPESGVIATFRDITERRRAGHELAAATSLLRATLDNMEQGLLVLDEQLRIRLWNDRLDQIFAHAPMALWAGRPIEEIIDKGSGNDRTRAAAGMAFLSRGLELRQPAMRELAMPHGGVVEMRITPMPEGGLIANYLDITERKRTESDVRRAKEEAELASRSKSEFLANMSHELRTPLNAIIGFADILKGEIFGRLGDPRYLDYAADIRDSGQHLLKLINDVLDVSKVEFGKIELTEEPVDVANVVAACIRLMRGRVEAAELHLTHALPHGLPLVQCDELRLKQVLLNLLSNAVKFTPAGGRIAIHTALDDRGLGIVVEDSGIGIAASDLDKALRPFGQIDSRLARKYQGTGLGLPLAKSMLEMHGGRLEIVSTPGVGTKATAWLPAERILFAAGVRGAAAAEA